MNTLPPRLARLARPVALLGATALLTSGCGLSVYELPLPGGTDTGEDPIRVHVKFADVLDLVPQSTVKVNDVSVGKVTAIDLDGYVADVAIELRNDVELPDNTVATIRQTSLLGEKFVSLAPPETGARGELSDGEVIPIERSGRNPEVEEVLGALSLVLNGGGVAQLKTITSELNTALEGREGSARSLLGQIELLMGQLDNHKQDIVDAIEALNRLSVSVNRQIDTVDAAFDELPSALDSIDQQRADLVKMLTSLEDLSGVGVRVIRASKESTVDSLQQLTPVLGQFAAAGDNFAKAFSVFLTYPFVDEVVGRDPQVARNLHMGDYTNLSVTLDLDLSEALSSEAPSAPVDTSLPVDPTQLVDDVAKCLESGDLGSEECQKVLADVEKLRQLVEECQKPGNRDNAVCQELNALPTVTPTGTGLPLPSISGLPGLPRAPFAQGLPQWGERGPTLGDLSRAFDRDLVALLVPPLASALSTKGGDR